VAITAVETVTVATVATGCARAFASSRLGERLTGPEFRQPDLAVGSQVCIEERAFLLAHIPSVRS
jgi:hypothetical protein